MSSYNVRQARQGDLRQLAELDANRWRRLPGTPALSATLLQEWLQRPGAVFLVAEHSQTGDLDGYYYGVPMQVDCLPTVVDAYFISDSVRDWGEAQVPTVVDGNCFYGINITSQNPTAAATLNEAILTIIGHYELFIGVARLSTFERYYRQYGQGDDRVQVAKWYAAESLRLIRGSEQAKSDRYVPLRRPDHVLRHHTTGLAVELVAVVPYIASDVNSGGLGAVLVTRHPHSVQ